METVGTLNRLARTLKAFTRELARTETLPLSPHSPHFGLALGGGFARGLAHVGVLKVLEEEQIPISFIGGTSVGAVIGAAYASGVSPKELEEIAALVRFKDFARWTISRFGFATNDRMTGFLDRILKVKTFEELRLPLAVTATDFVTGDAVVFSSGSLCDAVRASCAYPGMFLPVNVNGRMLVDGMLSNAVPTVPLRSMGADRVLAVYLSAHWVNVRGPRHVFDVIGQCFSIAQAQMCGVWQGAADVVIEPDVTGVSYDGFEHASDLIQAGETAARAILPQIRAWFAQPESKPHKTRTAVPAPAKLPAA